MFERVFSIVLLLLVGVMLIVTTILAPGACLKMSLGAFALIGVPVFVLSWLRRRRVKRRLATATIAELRAELASGLGVLSHSMPRDITTFCGSDSSSSNPTPGAWRATGAA